MFNGVVVVVGRALFISCAIQQSSESIGCDFCDNFPIHRIQIKVNNFGKLCRSIPAVCVALVLFFFRMIALFQRMPFFLIESIYMDFTWIQFRFVFSFQDYDFVVGTVFVGVFDAFCNNENLLTWKLGELNTRGIFIPLPKCRKKNIKKDLV